MLSDDDVYVEELHELSQTHLWFLGNVDEPRPAWESSTIENGDWYELLQVPESVIIDNDDVPCKEDPEEASQTKLRLLDDYICSIEKPIGATSACALVHIE